jgi:hypothetical protein
MMSHLQLQASSVEGFEGLEGSHQGSVGLSGQADDQSERSIRGYLHNLAASLIRGIPADPPRVLPDLSQREPG